MNTGGIKREQAMIRNDLTCKSNVKESKHLVVFVDSFEFNQLRTID